MGHLIGNVAAAIVTDDMATKFGAIAKTANDAVTKVSEYKHLLDSGIENAMASMMAGIAAANPCVRARKCLLVPYKDTGNVDGGKGCCPGQTGHHLLPGAMFNEFKPVFKDGKQVIKDGKQVFEATGKLRECWKKYDHDAALTICLEGTSNSSGNGSHGLLHSETAVVMEDQRASPDMSYEVARNRIAGLMTVNFGCNADCIKEQLDDSLKKMHTCGKIDTAKVTPHSGQGCGGPEPHEIQLPHSE